MNEYLISSFIDNELCLDEKIEFTEEVHANSEFKVETISLLKQEKRIRESSVHQIPNVLSHIPQKVSLLNWPFRKTSLGFMAASFILLFFIISFPIFVHKEAINKSYRFVIFRPNVTKVEITGSFTDWQSKELRQIGESGYWEIFLNIPKGEHRYSYILENDQRITDPTILTRENDDFGGQNSIFLIPS